MNPFTPISSTIVQPKRIFAFLIGYRWLSLIPPLGLLLVRGERPFLFPLIMATIANLLITIWYRQLNEALQSRPWLLLIDLLMMTGFIAFSGELGTPSTCMPSIRC